MERFANNADSTLNGAIDNSTTSIEVADGSPFPSAGNFRLIFGGDPDTAEYVVATARDGNTITLLGRGAEGSSAQSWADGTTVTHILTKGAVEELRDTLKGKTLHASLETIGSPQDGYALSWINSDGYWAARPGSPFTVVGNEIFTSGNLFATKYSAGAVPLTTVGFAYTSDVTQTFTVPAGVTSLRVKMWGPGGGTGNYSGSGGGGAGGYSTGFISVTPGEQLILVVGSGGKKSVSSNGNGGLGGWPGGGFGARGDASAGGGGGYTGIFNTSISQANALMVAGGGGGASGFGNYGAGGGGGLTGGSSASTGKGGSQVAGGLNSNNTSSPAYTVGGMFTGGTAFTDNTTSVGVDSGGGGSGYWGGGAGQSDGGAGGGGSGFVHAIRITSGSTTAGANAPVGTAAAQPTNTTDLNYIAGVGIGGAATGTGTNGGDGYIVFQWGGLISFDKDSIDFANGAVLSTLENDLTISSLGKITLQSATELLLSSSTTSTLASPNTTVSSTTTTTISGTQDVRFNTAGSLRGYVDVNGVLRLGPSAATTATLQGVSAPFANSDYLYFYNASGSAWAEIIAGATNARAALQVMNVGAGGTSTVGVSLFSGGTIHSTTEYAGNGIIEQSGANTSALIFSKKLGDGTSFASTGAIWQSGAWTIGRSTNNDTSAEAQAGLTGPLLNITQTTGGSLSSVANQVLAYNTAGTITLQGHVGHALIANTTTVATTTTSKFVTNVGRRVNTVVTTTNLGVSAGTEVIIVGTLSGSITVTLPSGPTAGDTYTVKDQAGGCATNNIIVSGNGNNIDGAATYTMNTNYQSITVVFANGTWSII